MNFIAGILLMQLSEEVSDYSNNPNAPICDIALIYYLFIC